jgi:hypothetical protein
MTRRTLVFALALLAAPLAASAQPSSSGPMTIEQLHSGFLGAPDVKVTRVDGHTSELVGGYAGWVVDDTIFFGAGGYWLANGSRDREMGYGGFVVQWLGHSSGRVGYGAKALLGGGQATLAATLTSFTLPRTADVDLRNLLPTGRVVLDQLKNPTIRFTNILVREGFFVAEPEANVSLRLTDHFRLVGGAGYRFIGSDRADNRRLRGATGTLSLQIF